MIRKALALLTLCVACKGTIVNPPGYEQPVAPGVSQDLAPLVVSLGATGPVSWSIDPGGGTISAAGLYTAPNCATIIAALPVGTVLSQAGLITGTDRVTATWQNGSVNILITVAESVLSVEVNPSSVELPPGGTVQFHATVHFTCHDQIL